MALNSKLNLVFQLPDSYYVVETAKGLWKIQRNVNRYVKENWDFEIFITVIILSDSCVKL